MATPLYEGDDLLGWEGIGFPGEAEAAEDFRLKLAESFQEYALADDSELTKSGKCLKKKLLDMVKKVQTNEIQNKK